MFSFFFSFTSTKVISFLSLHNIFLSPSNPSLHFRLIIGRGLALFPNASASSSAAPFLALQKSLAFGSRAATLWHFTMLVQIEFILVFLLAHLTAETALPRVAHKVSHVRFRLHHESLCTNASQGNEFCFWDELFSLCKLTNNESLFRWSFVLFCNQASGF